MRLWRGGSGQVRVDDGWGGSWLGAGRIGMDEWKWAGTWDGDGDGDVDGGGEKDRVIRGG